MNVNKPVGISSYDVIRKVKHLLHYKKVGHAGTLDPFAQGVLIVLIGRGATKQMDDFLKKSKCYRAVLKLGEKTDTGDKDGEIISRSKVPELSFDKVKKNGESFLGEYLQTPPQYSAKKVNGKPAYKYARKGIKVALTPKKVFINEIKIEAISHHELIFSVDCSSGTYIRVLGEELAEKLGTVGHLTQLTRLSVGEYHLENAASFDQLEEALAEEIKLIETQTEKSTN